MPHLDRCYKNKEIIEQKFSDVLKSGIQQICFKRKRLSLKNAIKIKSIQKGFKKWFWPPFPPLEMDYNLKLWASSAVCRVKMVNNYFAQNSLDIFLLVT